jgi:hypothetical protein
MKGYEVSFTTFCRRAIVDRDTGFASVVDVLPNLVLNAILPPEQTGTGIEVNMNGFFFVACLRRTDLTTSAEMRIPIKGIVTIGEQTAEVDLPNAGIPQGLHSWFVTINIGGGKLNMPATAGRYEPDVNAKLIADNKTIAELKLPVLVELLQPQPVA